MSGTVNYNYLAEDPTRSISDTISKWQGVQKNALDIQQAQAQVEQGKAAQAAIDPATGQFDQAKYNQLLAANPMAARGAVAAAQAGVTLDTDTYKLHTARMGQANDALGTLIGRYPNGIPQDAANAAIDQETSTGLITPAQAQQLKTQFSTDPRQNSVVATQLYSHNMTTQQQLDRIYGTRPAVSTGGGTAFPTIPAPGTPGPTPFVPNTMTPAELDTPGEVTLQDTRRTLPDGSPNPNYGNKQPYTRREVMTGQGYTFGPNGEVIPPGYAIGSDGKLAPAGQSGQPGQLGTGRYPTVPPALQGPNAKPAAPTPPASAPPATTPPPAAASPGTAPPPAVVPGGNLPVGTTSPAATPPAVTPPAAVAPVTPRPVTEVSPGEKGTMEAAGPAFQREVDTGTKAQSQQALLANMLTDTKQFLPGAYAETMKNWRTRLSPIFGVNETALAAADSFDKIAAQLADAQGAGSDSRMAVNIAANPHSGMSASGVDLVLRQLQGNADYLQARQKLAQAWPAKSDYSGFASSVSQLDPRVFQYERMTGPQKTDWFKAMSPGDQKTFMAAHGWAENKGLVGGG